MSIMNCNKCAVAIDTDFDVETLVEQKNEVVCRPCAIPQCYFVEIRDISKMHKGNYWTCHFIKALNEEDCIEKIHDQFGVLGFNDVRIRHDGTWESFEKDSKG